MSVNGTVHVFMGSKSDLETAKKVEAVLVSFGVDYKLHVASAHKTHAKVLGLVKEIEKESKSKKVVIVAVIGLSNALSGMLAGSSTLPIVTLPNSDNDHDVFSCLRMPSGISHLTVLGAENAALSAVKILALGDDVLSSKIREYQAKTAEKVGTADSELGN